MIRGALPIRFAWMLVAALEVFGCGRGSAGAHFKLTGAGRYSWQVAAEQVLKGHCGIQSPSSELIQSTADLLREFNIQHVKEEGGCLGGFPKPDTPQGVDHRNCGIGSFLGSTTEIALPPKVCEEPALARVEADVAPPPPPPKRDAGKAEAEVPRVVADGGTQPLPSDAVTERAEDIGVGEAIEIGAVPQPPEAGKDPTALIREKLGEEINSSRSLISALRQSEDRGMIALANRLSQRVSAAEALNNNLNATVEELQTAYDQLRRERLAAKRKLDEFRQI